MYKIGAFAMLNKVSKRMLRYYDEKGVLQPQKDENTGYRFYDDDDIERINNIKRLRRYKFSVEEMNGILEKDSVELKAIYNAKIDELKETATEYMNIIGEMYKEVDFNSNLVIDNQYDVSIGIQKSFHGLSIRKSIKEEELEQLIDSFIESVKEINPVLRGKYIVIYHGISEEGLELHDVEVCQLISGVLEYEVIEIKQKVFAEINCIKTIHIGDYSQINHAYSALYNWAVSNGYNLNGPYIEKYYTDEYVTLDRNEFITEIYVSIKKA